MALNISSNIVASEKGRELVQHGSALFPIACYAEDLSSYSVAWHWHEEFEYVLCTKGPLHVDVKKTRWSRHRKAQPCSTRACSIRALWAGWTPSSGRSSSAP